MSISSHLVQVAKTPCVRSAPLARRVNISFQPVQAMQILFALHALHAQADNTKSGPAEVCTIRSVQHVHL